MGTKNNTTIANTMRDLSLSNSAPKGAYFILVALFLVSQFFVTQASRNHIDITIFGVPAQMSDFTGVFASISNALTFFLTVFYRKTGFITSLVFLIVQQPMMVINLFVTRSSMSVPGIFTNVFTLVCVSMIYINQSRSIKYQYRIREQAVTDSLTSLPNRFACSELLNDLIAKNNRFAVVSIDLNNFKSINDTMGHDFGNRVIKAISERWKTLADSPESGTSDFICRISGDEFALVIRDAADLDEITNTARMFKDELEKKLTIDDCDYYITACWGYAVYPDDASSSDALFSSANAAMHESQRLSNSNILMHFSPEILKTEHNLEVEGKIRKALEQDRVFFNLQPQYDMNHKLRGFEALARMKDNDGSVISPADFIPVAEKTGLVDKIDLKVFRLAAAFLADVMKQKDTDITISVNVSVRHLMKNNFIEEIRKTLDEYNVPADRFEIEITESIMIDSADRALQCIEEIRNMGMQVAIDDFGTGYSSLSYLNSFPANMLKIDKSFIDGVNASESSRQYVATIISIGHVLNLDVISEGVESDDQLETLRKIGCDYIQGFVWGRPLMPEEAEKLI
ncbi:MAG: EAL domain-containing protein [Clostridiales bacterium]|nr:EAL domain-containing protein [Clostridiales bacterium]